MSQEDQKTGVFCDECGHEMQVGEFPFCRGDASKHQKGMGGFDSFEPYVDADILPGHDPRRTHKDPYGRRGIMINTRTERRQLMKEFGLQYGSNHPGGREI